MPPSQADLWAFLSDLHTFLLIALSYCAFSLKYSASLYIQQSKIRSPIPSTREMKTASAFTTRKQKTRAK